MTDRDPKAAYIRDVTERTRSYLRELQQESERLRSRLAVSEAERTRLGAEVIELKQKLEAQIAGGLGLDAAGLARLEEENRRYAEQYVVLEQKNTHLANLYVASYRLHETLSREEVLSILQEIVVNLIGCEQHAIYELSEGGDALRLLAGMGIDEARCKQVRLGDDEVSRKLAAGEVFVAPGAPVTVAGHPHRLTASVPLRLAGKTTGAIALYRLLPQKPGVEDIDRELFELLAVHAGMALHTTKLHQASRAR
jgi:GAF domain-containing protein